MDDLELLTQVNLNDLVASFGWERQSIPSRALRVVFVHSARKFARQMLEFDTAVGMLGLAEAARLSLQTYTRGVYASNRELLPAGPFLALSNHPGMTDTLALFSTLNRPNLRIIAIDRPFLKALRHTSERLDYVTDDQSARMVLVRQVSSHLRAGGAAMTFPAGQIEPDPDVYPGAVDALQNWTDSVGVFIRMAPETPIVPMLVRGVIWDKAAHHQLTKLKSTKEEREKLAATLQLLAQLVLGMKPVSVRVQIGKPITVAALGSKDTHIIHQAVLSEMKRLIEHPPEGEGVRVV